MAKGNMLQGMARGKVGDVVFSRLNGEQISRVRNRHPQNPRSKKQLYQRAIMATVMQAYSAGKVIFDHSFQGEKVGSGCQRRFMSLNARKLREALADDVNLGRINQNAVARVVAPGATTPVPFSLIVSQGNYNQEFFSLDNAGYTYTFPDKQENESCAAYCSRNGLIPGDLYTIVGIVSTTLQDEASAEQVFGNQRPGKFVFTRMQVKENALTDDTAIGSLLASNAVTAGVPFVVTEIYNHTHDIIAWDPTDAFTISELFSGSSAGAYGIIRSRLDQDLRSNSEMHVVPETNIRYNYGIANPYVLPVWAAGTQQVGESDLILEGGDF